MMSIQNARYDYNYDLKQKRITDWSGTQDQQWTSPQRSPQKTKFPYGMKWKDHHIDHRTGKFFGRAHKDDDSGGKWYLEEELIMTYEGDKRKYNIYQKGYLGGKILMTKQQASQMGLTKNVILSLYNQDNHTPSAFQFFEYRKDGSITGIKKKARLEMLK